MPRNGRTAERARGREAGRAEPKGRWRGRGRDGLVLLALLALPAWAVARTLPERLASAVAGWGLAVSLFTYLRYAWDKRQARAQGWRESEVGLHLMELIGGWPGAYLAHRRLRHKSAKGTYQFWFVLIVGLHQGVALDALLGWPVGRSLLAKLTAI